MKNLFLFLLAHCLLPVAYSQPYWQQQADFSLDVSLNDRDKTLDGFERILYTNHSPDTLRYIWFHLWPNAYKNDRTAFSDQLLQNGNTQFYFSTKEQRGYINRLDFKVDGVSAKTEDHPQYIDVVKLLLPKPLPPQAQVSITTPFHVKLPFNFSRGGYRGESFQITQWYPKPAVYDKNGWHPMPYLDQGEFYSEFGGYDVRITLPKDYVVAATGELKDVEEKEWLKNRSPQKMFGTILQKEKTATKAKPQNTAPKPTATGTKTLHFVQTNVVHDFAWFADKNFWVDSDTLRLPSGRIVNVLGFYGPLQKESWKRSVAMAKKALRFYSTELGEYPYPTASVVAAYQSAGGGMEYPTIAAIDPAGDSATLEGVIAHEIGHNWFYGLLASNERDHPWMDEGLNSFYENKYAGQNFGPPSREAELLFQAYATSRRDQPIATPSPGFSKTNYGLVAYHKTAEWMKQLEQKLGAASFRKMMQDYFETWKFRHPQPEDFKRIAANYLGAETEAFFAQLERKGVLPGNELSGTAWVMPLKKNAVEHFLKGEKRNVFIATPALGFNLYDKLMIGGAFTNYGSPVAKLNFLAVPLYATGSKSLSGLGRLNYAVRSDGFVRKTDLFFNASTFTANEFTSNEGETYRMRFTKLVPGLRLIFREPSPRSTSTAFLQWKTFFINEQSLSIKIDSIKRPNDTLIQYRYSTPRTARYLNQLQLGVRNLRALYPFEATLQAEQGKDFVRTTFTGNYFFNYAKGGGLNVRVFAGKFFYLGEKTTQKRFDNDRYFLNLSGPNGYEDYTYSDYFFGRNRFSGWASQQLMIRDGAFKVRTDLLSNKVGKTDDWLMAANFSTTVPQNLNPLSVLPFKIPLRVFADVGTYAGAWDRKAEADRFLFDIGLHVPLFAETVNLYVPLLYSKVYGDYFKSTLGEKRFWKTISFSVNLYNTAIKKLSRETDIY